MINMYFFLNITIYLAATLYLQFLWTVLKITKITTCIVDVGNETCFEGLISTAVPVCLVTGWTLLKCTIFIFYNEQLQ